MSTKVQVLRSGICLSILFCLLSGCDDDPGSSVFYSGLLQVSVDGRVLGGDGEGDWEPSGVITGFGAYPNPSRGGPVSIAFALSEPARVKLILRDAGETVATLWDEFLDGRSFEYRLDTEERFDEGIYRVHLWAKTTDGRVFYSYGDISIRN